MRHLSLYVNWVYCSLGHHWIKKEDVDITGKRPMCPRHGRQLRIKNRDKR